MKRILLIAICLLAWNSNAQITLKGVVKDSIGEPLEMANVIALDTVAKKISSFGFTDAKGNFKLDLQRNRVYNIKISYIGYKEISEFINSGENDFTKNYTMYEDNMLEGINIVSKMPVTVKGDTIIYNADSFKNGTERKLEDVLEKLPGVEINDAGQIEVEGKPVEKITVDGKEFFSGDTKLASKNIPSNAVDKIQVLRNFGDVSQLKGVQDNQDRVAINIKLKEGKKNFWFGDIYAGAGASPNDGLYLFQPKLFYYTPKYTLNVIGDINNLGEAVLDRRDVRGLRGGFRSQSPSNGTNISLASAGIGFLTATARNANRIETRLTALNYSYSPNKKLDLSGYLIWSGNSNEQLRVNSIQYNDGITPDETRETSTNQTSNSGLFNFKAIYKKNINNQLNYDLNGRFTNEFRNDSGFSQVIGNTTPILENENATPFTITQNLSYFYTASEKSIFALEVQHAMQDEDPFYIASIENLDRDPNNNLDGFDDVADVLGVDKTQQQYLLEQDRRVKSNQLDAKLDYYYIINDISNFNFVGGTILSRQNFDSRFFQLLDDGSTLDPNLNIPNVANAENTNDTEYNFRDLYAGMRYRVKSGIFTFRPGFTAHTYHANNTQFGTEYFEDSFSRILPELNIIAQFKQSESLRFDYSQSVNFTDVNQVARGIVASSFDSFFFGNNDILNARAHNVRLNYSSFNLFNNTFVFAGANYTKSIEQITTEASFIPGSVVSTSTNLNLPFDVESMSAFAGITKTFGKIRTRLNGNYNESQFFQLFGGTTNEGNTKTYGLRPGINTNFIKAPNFGIRYNVSFTNQENEDLNSGAIRSFNTVRHSPTIDFDAYIWNALTLRSDFSFNEVRQDGNIQNTFKIWNLSMSYRKNRDAKMEYEFEASNILGTESILSVNNGAISNSINETFILPRLLTFRVRYTL